MRQQLIIFAILLVAMMTANIAQAQEDFPYPSVPAELTTPQERAEFLVRHYWDNINFQDTTLIHRGNMLEQGFVNFIDLLPRLGSLEQVGIQQFAQQAIGKNETFDKYLKDLAERYLYTASSPMRNDTLYCHLLAAINQLPTTGDTEKEQNLFLINSLNKNKVGSQATDFSYTDEQGKKHRISDITIPYTLLYMYDPDCETCHEVEKEMNQEPRLKDGSLITIVRVNAMARRELWQDYYFRSFPTIYLLDNQHRVVLKDAEIAQIVSFLAEHKR